MCHWARIQCRTRGTRWAIGNMMLILDYVLHLAQMMSFEEIDDALKFLTVNGATTLGLRDMYGLEKGQASKLHCAGRR